VKRATVVTASTTTVAIILAAVLTGMVNWLGFRHYVRGDWTKSQIYSLSDKTLNVLKGVNSDISAIVFMTPSTPLFAEVKELLQRYQAKAPRLKVEFIDPERDPLRTRQLAQDFGVSAANTVVFSAGDRKKYVTSDQLAEYDYSGMQYGQQPRMKGFKGEEQFTAAILGVVNPKQPKIYFSTGHGERELDGYQQDGLSQFKEYLKRDNLDAQTTTLLKGEVPADCDLLVIAGPRAPFADVERNAVKAYLDKGGRVLLMLDPVLGGQARPSGLEDLVKAYGVEFGNDLVIDPNNALPFVDLSTVFANDFRSHAVVNGLKGMAVVLPVTRSVTTATATGATSTQLLMTSAGGWGEHDLAAIAARHAIQKDPTDTQGPVSLGVAAESESDKQDGWRLVAFGNSYFIANGQLPNAGNLNLGLNSVNWLAKREQSLGIAPRAPEQVQLFLSRGQMRTITVISLIGLPLLAMVLGGAVWWRRRR
jgi:ABC-type uncharacterized transport system involved in gliding motility auxiliary subunit